MCDNFDVVYQFNASTLHAKSESRICKHDITIIFFVVHYFVISRRISDGLTDSC